MSEKVQLFLKKIRKMSDNVQFFSFSEINLYIKGML